jgi:glycosyltransferase involved in cell wall biosynthesis
LRYNPGLCGFKRFSSRTNSGVSNIGDEADRPGTLLRRREHAALDGPGHPRQIDGIENVEILIIDDGSTDRTALLAREIGVDHIVRNKRNLGLARAFIIGIDACLRRGADTIVNTDGDNQYAGADIPKLIQPILDGRADIVIGDRQPHRISHFSPIKRALQRIGSLTVRRLSGLDIPDPVSGFRAYSREAALALNVVSEFSYTIESIVQASSLRFSTASVPVTTNQTTRQSRLFESIPHFRRPVPWTMVLCRPRHT